MKKQKAIIEKWCPLTGQYTHLKHDHVIERARALWSRPGVELRTPEGRIIPSLSFTGEAIEKARSIYDKWAALQQDPAYIGMLENKMQMALNPEMQDREEYLREILLWFRELDASPLEVFSILAIHEARVTKNDAWPVELLALTERYSPDTLHGKKQREDALRGWKIAGEQQRQEREPVWERWRAKAKELWRKHPEWSKRRVAIEIRKTEPDKPALTTITPRIEK